jgi:2-polyprenyl-6-methoxyphenol hydroxylase-like FAD-dependent oxidoreductase
MDQAEVGQELFDSTRQLQILIVGDSIAGLTLARLLQQRGFDPLVLQTGTNQTLSTLTTLWNPGVRLLQRVGIDQHEMENVGKLENLLVRSNTTDETLEAVEADTDYPPPLVLSTTELHDTLHEQIGNGRYLGKEIASLSDRDDSVTVQFDDGVAESFDLVVNAGNRSLLEPSFKSDPGARNVPLAQVELTTPVSHDRRRTVIEGWIDDVLVQQIPSPEASESAVLRMTSRNDTIPVGSVVTRWRRRTAVEPLDQSAGTPRTRTVGVDRRVTLGTDSEERWWADGRRVFLSAAAVELPPASGFRIGFGIADGWVLADEIAHASDSPATIGIRYASRRRNRFDTIRNRAGAVSSIHSYPVCETEPLKTVTAFRSVCLGTFCTAELADLQAQSDVCP